MAFEESEIDRRRRDRIHEQIEEIERLRGLLSEIIPAPDDDLTHADGVGWHCPYCGLCADDPDLESFEHHEDCWLVRARAELEVK